MNDTDRKFLTEWMGEKWDEPCCLCGGKHYRYAKRTFNNPSDQHDVFKMLVEKGKFKGYVSYGTEIFLTEINADCCCDYCEEFITWLFIDPERFCQLAAGFLRN